MSSNNILPLSRSTSVEHGDSYSSCESTALPVATTVATIGDPSFQPVVQPRPPGSFHLTPCTLDQFLQLDNPAEYPYELVYGLLVSVKMADDPEHNSIILYLTFLITVLPLAFHPQTIAFPNRAYLPGQQVFQIHTHTLSLSLPLSLSVLFPSHRRALSRGAVSGHCGALCPSRDSRSESFLLCSYNTPSRRVSHKPPSPAKRAFHPPLAVSAANPGGPLERARIRAYGAMTPLRNQRAPASTPHQSRAPKNPPPDVVSSVSCVSTVRAHR